LKKGETRYIMDGDSIRLFLLVIVFVALVSCSGYFSATESAFTVLNKIRIKSQADDGDKKAKRALYITNHFERALTTILVGNNIVNIAAASVATVIAAQLLAPSALDEDTINLICTIYVTVVVFIFGEMIPKSLASDRSESISLLFAAPLRLLMKLFTPIVAVFSFLNKLVSRVFKAEEEPSITEDELFDIIDTVEEEGVVDEEQSDMLKSALEFADTTASDVMTVRQDILYIDITMGNEQIKDVIMNTTHSRIPVCDGGLDNIIGTLPIRAFLKEYLKNPRLELRSLLIPAFFVKANANIDDLLTIMRQHRYYLAVVIDDKASTIGIVTIEDFLEELVGEIWDEDDVVDPDFIKLGGNYFRVTSRMTVGEAFGRIGLPAPASTIAPKPLISFILDTLGRMPEEEESFDFEDVEIIADEVKDGRLTQVVIHIPDEKEDEEQ
jgi:CBS domain containing-hemolysin-like protein